jgi:glycosyltransferase involved in cell wall biosynthesis
LSTVLAPLEGDAPLTRSGSSSRSLRVLQVIASIADVNGGASTAMWSTLDALRLRNVDVDLVTTNEDGLNRLMDVPFGRFIRQRGHRIRYFPARGDRYTTSWPLAAWLLRHVREYDIVHVHGLFRFAPVAAAHAAIVRGVPYVLTLHNTLGEWGLRNRRPLLKKLSIGLIEGRMLDHARKVHLCSADELRLVSRVRPLGARSAVFPLGIDFSLPAPEEVSTQAPEYGSFAGRKIVLFMSRIHEIKGLDTLITAFASVQNVHPEAELVIAGTGDEKLVAGLRALAQRVGVEQRTHWVGFVQGQRKRDLLASATVFVLPSHSENFGYAVIEAMLAGLPIITTANVPAGEFAIEAGAGVVFDGTSEDLALSIDVMLALPDTQRRQLGHRAELTVRQRLSLQTFGESLETLYQEVCQAPLTS